MNDITVRTATLSDAETIAANNLAMAQETEGRALDPDTLRRGVRRLLEDRSRGVYYLAQRDGRVVGQLLITREWSDWRNGWFWWVQSVYVLPQARGTGVYRTLHQHVKRQARQSPHVCGLRLYVDRRNTAARRVYERLGMRPTNYEFLETAWSPAASVARPEGLPTTASHGPIDKDLYCLRCGYNLRGLSGDPVRCPECGFRNPLGDVELPAEIIKRQLTRMESGPAYAVAVVLVFAACVALAVFSRFEAWQGLLVPGLPAVIGWPLLLRRFRDSCLGKLGWVGAILNYHFWGLLMIVTTIGAVPLAVWVAGTVVRSLARRDPFLFYLLSGIGLLLYVFVARYWVRWLYRRAKTPMETLQREVAVTLARKEIRRRMATTPRRGLFG